MPVQEGDGGGEPDRGGLPAKSNRPGPPPPGGGPGSGPPGSIGGGLAFMGRRSPLLRGFSSMPDAMLPVLLRRRGLYGGAPPPAVPGRGDTVPAMLQPGEKVIPQNVAQDPNYGPMADQMIAQGRMGMGLSPGAAYGQGPVQMMGGGEVPDMPGARPSRAIRLLQLILELDDMDNAGTSDDPNQHFAFGGTAMPWSRQTPFGGARPSGGPQPLGPAGAPPPAPGGYNRDTEGNVTNYNPASPWGNYQGNQNAYGLGLLYRGIGNAGAAGAFDPRGNQALINSQIEAAQGTKDALVRRQMTAADLYGLDPAQQAVAKLQAQRDTGRGVQDISAQIRANAAQSQDEFFKNLYSQLTGAGIGYSTNEQNARNERIAQQNAGRVAKQNQFNPGQFIGQIGGAAAGAYMGRPPGVPRTAIAPPMDPGLQNLPRP